MDATHIHRSFGETAGAMEIRDTEIVSDGDKPYKI